MADRTRRIDGRRRCAVTGIVGLALALLALVPGRTDALVGVALKDLIDPVPPGGVLPYSLRLVFLGGGTPVCFNPAPECLESPALCSIPTPACVGDSFVGFYCDQSANQGADCGVGDPPVPNVSLCVKKSQGVCIGGTASGLPCTSGCPGTSFTCVRAFNEGFSCGSGSPPEPVPSYCLPNPHGICTGGPNFGLPCYAPDGTVTPDCPSDPNAVAGVTLTLPIPTGVTFLDADGGGTSDGSNVTWNLPTPGACGVAGTPRCPAVAARFTVDSLLPLGTIIQAQATAADSAGPQMSALQRTTVGTLGLKTLVLALPNGTGRDRVVYRTVFSLPPGSSIDASVDAIDFQLTNVSGTLVDLNLPGGDLLPAGTGWLFKTRDPGLSSVVLRQLYPGYYELIMKASHLDLPPVTSFTATLTLTIGDDVFTQDVTLLSKRGGKRFIASK